ncbi:MAG: hypothetical protein JXR96_24595 [Deltaproteobacteria bacterium]|nr:hypothetical protein [Deltaproteobacteria bacterium]
MPPAAREPDGAQALEARVLQSVVKCRRARRWSYGFVFQDRRTIILDGLPARAGQKVAVQTLDGERHQAEVRRLQVLGKARAGLAETSDAVRSSSPRRSRSSPWPCPESRSG